MKKFRSIFEVFPVWVLALALMMGLLYVLPQILLKKAAEREGRFFVLPNLNHLSDDALSYLPRAREIYDGHFPSEMHFSAYKDTVWFVYPPLPQLVTAGFLVLFWGEVSSAVIGIIFVFAIINFLCFYTVGRVMLVSRLWATAVATAALFTHAPLRIPAMFYQKGVAVDVLANMLPYLRVPMGELSLVRIDDPLLTMPLYLISFLLLYRFSALPTARRALALGIALGILSYVYLYYWVTIFTIAGVRLLYEMGLAWRRGSYEVLKSWMIFYGAFALLFLPHIVNFLIFRGLPGGPDYIIRKGIEMGRYLRLSVYPDYIFYALVGSAAFFLFRKKKPEASEPAMPFSFAAAVLIAMTLLWNVQLLAGFNMEPFHWWKSFSPLLFLLVAVMVKAVYDRVSHRQRVWRVAQTALIALILSMSVKKTLNVAAFVHPPKETVRSYSVPQSIAASWEWINASVPPDSAIISPSLVSSNQISIFTHADPWMAAPLNSVAPTLETERRFVQAHKILEASPDEMLLRLAGPPFEVPRDICPDPCTRDRDRVHDRFELSFEFYSFGLLYGAMFSPSNTFDAITKAADGSIPQETLERLREYYTAYRPHSDQFPAHTYVYIGPWERLLSKKAGDAFADMKPVFANEDVRIYRIR